MFLTSIYKVLLLWGKSYDNVAILGDQVSLDELSMIPKYSEINFRAFSFNILNSYVDETFPRRLN